MKEKTPPVVAPRGGLVIARKEQQTVLIGPDVRLTVLKIRYGEVKIHISAPSDVVILREELSEAPAA